MMSVKGHQVDKNSTYRNGLMPLLLLLPPLSRSIQLHPHPLLVFPLLFQMFVLLPQHTLTILPPLVRDILVVRDDRRRVRSERGEEFLGVPGLLDCALEVFQGTLRGLDGEEHFGRFLLDHGDVVEDGLVGRLDVEGLVSKEQQS